MLQFVILAALATVASCGYAGPAYTNGAALAGAGYGAGAYGHAAASPLAYGHAAVAAPASYGHESYPDAHPAYKFEYSVHDPHTGDSKTQAESRNGHHVSGFYSVGEPDGSTRTVHYADNGHGFEATVHKEPGHHPVVAPAPVHAAPLHVAPAPAYHAAPAPAYHAALASAYQAAPAPAYHAAPSYGNHA